MSRKSDLVEKQFSRFNCAQTVFSLFAKDLGLDETTALKIASGFGGGMNCAETCGAVTGSYMVIGMKHGHSSSDSEAKAKTKELVKKFNQKFKIAHGSLICKELIGYDVVSPDGSGTARELPMHTAECAGFLKTACDILEEEF